MGDAMVAADGKGQAADGGFAPVMVRLTAAEVETVDTLITAGIANSRAGAIRWALTASKSGLLRTVAPECSPSRSNGGRILSLLSR
jgi:hypothetical protein